MKTASILIAFLFTINLVGQVQKQAIWQQHVSYDIDVSLDDEEHLLNGNIEMDYTNNSPDTLNEIWIHLWPNAYKNNQTAFAKQLVVNNNTSFYYAKKRERGFIDSLNFIANGSAIEMTYDPIHIDIAKLSLKEPLLPGESVKLSSTFQVKIPGSFSRMGHIKNSYQLTQWYPKPAVYDVNGWNTMPYLNQGEFYSEFGDFDVSITVPSNYVVAATGVLQDSSEIAWLDERSLYFKGRGNRDEEEIASSALLKTLHFKQDKIHDFAWFADKDFYVFKSSQMLKDSSKTISTFLYSADEDDKASLKYVNQGIEFYSEKVGNYPYASASAVVSALKAGGGMEYPMITVLADADRTTTVHEIGHNWFYGILGTNERVYPWMDESINTYYENRYSKALREERNSSKNYNSKFTGNALSDGGLGIVYAYSLANNTQQATNLHSADYTSTNYGGIIYGKGAYNFSVLQQFLGDSLFDAAMQNFYNSWKFKHPLPQDFEESITNFTNKDLTWFFQDLMASTKRYDYKISRIKYKKVTAEELASDQNNYQVLVKNRGKAEAPFQIMTLDENGDKLKSRWDSGFSGKKWITIPGTERLNTLTKESLKKKEAKRTLKRMDKVSQVALNLDNPLIESNIHNNRIKTSGILKKTEKFALGGANHMDRRTTPSLVPLANYNFYDNWMFGAMLNNLAHWERPFYYYASAMYSNSLAPFKYEAFAKQSLAIHNKYAYRMDIFAKTASFGHNPGPKRSTYRRHNFGTALYLNNKKSYSKTLKRIQLDYNMLSDVLDKDKSESLGVFNQYYSNILSLNYEFKNNSKINPLEYDVTFEQINTPQNITIGTSASIQKLFGEASKVFHFSKQKSYLKVRGFAGFIFGNSTTNFYNYSMGGNSGRADYKYENNLFSRSEGFTGISNGVLGARVLVSKFSGMRIPSFVLSEGSVQAINLEYSFKNSFPINVYLDASYSANPAIPGGAKFNYVGGLNFTLIKDYVEISLPLMYSAALADKMSLDGIKTSKNNSVNYNPFKDWHRLIVFKLNIDFDQDKFMRLTGF